MNFQETLNKIREAHDRGLEFNPADYEPDPKLTEYAKSLNTQREIIFDIIKAKNYVDYHLNDITNLTDRKFEYTEFNKPIIQAFFQYFTNDIAFYPHTKNHPKIFINRISLKKGILLIGGYGTGKSTIITAFQRVGFPGKEFKSKQCPNIAENWTGKNRSLIEGNWYFDEFGHETEGQFAKKDSVPVMAKILEDRYYQRQFVVDTKTGFTILSTNLTMDEIGKKYGERLADRIRDMFNIVLLLGNSFRN